MNFALATPWLLAGVGFAEKTGLVTGGLGGESFLDRCDGVFGRLAQSDLSAANHSFFVENRDQVCVGEVAFGRSFVFYAQQCGQFEDLCRAAVKKGPLRGRQLTDLAEFLQSDRCVSFRINGHENIADFALELLRELFCDALDVGDDHGAGMETMRVNHRNDLDSAFERRPLDFLPVLIGPGRLPLVQRHLVVFTTGHLFVVMMMMVMMSFV